MISQRSSFPVTPDTILCWLKSFSPFAKSVVTVSMAIRINIETIWNADVLTMIKLAQGLCECLERFHQCVVTQVL